MIRITEPSKWNERLLSRVYEKYPEESPLADWFGQITEGRAFLFEQAKELPTIDYAGIVEIQEKGLQARVGGGLDGRMDVREMFNFLTFMCRILDKPSLRLYGRKGWWRYLKHLGFELLTEVQDSSAESRRPSFIYEYKLTTEKEVQHGR